MHGMKNGAETLILDSEAVNALAHPEQRGVPFERARAVLTVAHERRALVHVPAPILAEVYRGPRFDAGLDHLRKSRGLVVRELTHQMARSAGHLLTKAKLSSVHAVDVFVVATALGFDRLIIATGDPQDIQCLAASHKRV